MDRAKKIRNCTINVMKNNCNYKVNEVSYMYGNNWE